MSTLFGNKIKALREDKQMPQRQLATILDIDTATFCKIEKGDRRARREQVITLSKFLEFDEKELLRLWSADKVYKIIADEDEPSQILDVVAESIETYKRKKATV